MIRAYLGHHRCGSSWLTSVIVDLCAWHHDGFAIADRPDGDEQTRTTDLERLLNQERARFLVYLNAQYDKVKRLPSYRAFHVVRDPRDVCLSGYYAHMHSHPDDKWPALRAHRKVIRSMNKHDGLLAELEFSSRFLDDMDSFKEDDDIMLVKMEDLIEDQKTWFAKILAHLNWPHEPVLIDKIIDKWSYEKLSDGRKRGEEDAKHHYRKGVVRNEWKEHFDAEHLQWFKRYEGLIERLGYQKTC